MKPAKSFRDYNGEYVDLCIYIPLERAEKPCIIAKLKNIRCDKIRSSGNDHWPNL